jgi:uncharacterized protein (DUF2249 family)
MVLSPVDRQQAAPPPSRTGGGASHGGAGERHGLAEEHAVLRHEVRRRDEAARTTLAAGRWPHEEIAALVAYLRYEVLDQAVTAERLLFPLAAEGTDSRMHDLVKDHVRLRDLTDQLAEAATVADPCGESTRLLALLESLQGFLDRHMRDEETVLSATTTAGIESLRYPFRCHLWFPLTEGPVLDLDALPREFAHRAALERFSRLRVGEHLLVVAGSELDGLWSLLSARLPGDYGWVYLEEGPERWRAEVTRRAPE